MDINERLLGRETGKEAADWLPKNSPSLEIFGSRGSSGTGIVTVGLSHGVSIPGSITINLKGSLEVPWGIMCSTGLAPIKTNGEFPRCLAFTKTPQRFEIELEGTSREQ